MSHQNHAPVNITSARPSRSADLHRREVRYLVSMGIRTVCFVLAVVTHGPARWLLVAAAFALPYLAVVFANAKNTRERGLLPLVGRDRPQVTARASEQSDEERPRSYDGQRSGESPGRSP